MNREKGPAAIDAIDAIDATLETPETPETPATKPRPPVGAPQAWRDAEADALDAALALPSFT